VDHDCDLGEAVHISPGAHLGGSVNIGEGTHVGIGASVRNNLSVGCWSTIGAGAAVVGPIPDRVVAFGVPCRVASGV
jgi:acetyltransferase EpsM